MDGSVPPVFRKLVRRPIEDVAAALGPIAQAKRPLAALMTMTISLVGCWFLYVPIHELMHAGGCLAAGGSVTELQIAPQYGGPWLARWIPFVVSGGNYAGRLSGFETHGHDLTYLATDFAPYLLTILLGVPMIRLCAHRWRPVLLGVSVVVAMAPIYGLFGDYYEMGSTITTGLLTALRGDETIYMRSLRSDDLFALIGHLIQAPDSLGLRGTGQLILAVFVVMISFVLGTVLALETYALGGAFATLCSGRRGDACPCPSVNDSEETSRPL